MTTRLKAGLGVHGAAVVWHGHVPRAELLAALATARAAVFPSYSESFGMAPLEAMASGCPTVYSGAGTRAPRWRRTAARFCWWIPPRRQPSPVRW